MVLRIQIANFKIHQYLLRANLSNLMLAKFSHYTVLHFQVLTSNTIIASQIITVLLITVADLIINVP